jgi:MinD-like ATPase involved in chromosome partitioning or flagellar assembly
VIETGGKPYIVRVSSQKGGVGKTTVAVNLATSLALMGYKTLLYDTDFSNPSVGFHLGLEDANIGIQSVLTKKTRLQNAIVTHDPSGMHVLPCELSTKMSAATSEQINTLKSEIIKEYYDFVIGDTPPGVISSEISSLYDEALILTTPDLPAMQSVLKLSAKYDRMHIPHSLIVNRVKHKNYELTLKDIEGAYEKKAAAVLPESEMVPTSIAKHIPVVLLDGKCTFSKEITPLSEQYAYKTEKKAFKRNGFRRYGFLKTLIRLITGKY